MGISMHSCLQGEADSNDHSLFTCALHHLIWNQVPHQHLGKHFESGARVSGRGHHQFGVLHSGPFILVVHVRADAWTQKSRRLQELRGTCGGTQLTVSLPSAPSSSYSTSFCSPRASLRTSGGRGEFSVVKNKYLCYREICGWTAPSANHSCKMHEEKGDLCCRALSLSSASFSFSFFSSIVRSRSSWAFLYRYSRLSLTSRRSCLTVTQQKNTEKQAERLRFKAHAPTKYRVFPQ